ncbi:CdaR family transcriptional regulator [Pseudonocardia sp. ICBG1293]|uniref:PucR family transcriptional regulator n=1 Tax=Pseudonocardia sp. ICBG1293 TaxID=2844382 RepID=UPI001CCDD31C|nr:helix-turn-helix domain-containing protein [Pseudonocardia sp. ICBG1293]
MAQSARHPGRQDVPPARAEDAETVTVTDLLAEPQLRNTLVAGRDGTSAVARWCGPLSELADAADPTEAGLVVHAAVARLRGPGGADVVREVVGAGAVALLVRLDPVDAAPPDALARLLPEARAAADGLRLPLALLPPGADFRAVSRLVATKVLAQSTHVLEYSDRVHRSLGEILARGTGIPALAHGMSRMAGVPALVVDLDGTVLAHESAVGRATRAPEQVVQVLHRYSETVAAAGGHQHAVSLAPVGTPAGAVVPLVAPVAIGGEPCGLVAVLEPVDAGGHDRAQRRVVVQEGAVLVGAEMLRIRSMTEAEERTRGDFVVDLVHGRFADGQQLLARARHHGFVPDERYVVLVVEPDPPVSDDARTVRRFQAAARAAERIEHRGTAPVLAAQLGGNLVVVAPVGTGPDGNEPRALAGAVASAVQARLSGTARVAFGSPGSGATGTAQSYREARTALSLARRVDAAPVVGYEDLRIFVALREVADSENGRRFAREVLAPLRRADGHNRSLESVVLAYIAESGNLNAAARRLGLHRNTTLYKLDRVSRAIGMDIRSSDTQFMVWLAHHVDTLASVNEGLDAELVPPP